MKALDKPCSGKSRLERSILVHRLSSLVKGHIESLINIDDPLRLHAAENNGSLNILSCSIFCLLKILGELLDLLKLILDFSSLLLLCKVVGLLLLSSPSALGTSKEKHEL